MIEGPWYMGKHGWVTVFIINKGERLVSIFIPILFPWCFYELDLLNFGCTVFNLCTYSVLMYCERSYFFSKYKWCRW